MSLCQTPVVSMTTRLIWIVALALLEKKVQLRLPAAKGIFFFSPFLHALSSTIAFNIKYTSKHVITETGECYGEDRVRV